MKKLLLTTTALVIAGCAGGPAAKKEEAAAPRPTYNEKIGAVTLDEQKTALCPKDNAYQKEDWRKVVAHANACVKAKDWVALDKIADHLAKSAPLTPWGAYYLSLVATARKDHPRAQWMLELALKKAPGEGLFHYELARLYWEMGDDAGAIREMKSASELNPALTEAHYIVGQLALRRDDLSEARKMFKRALASRPKHVPSLLAAAQVEIQAKDHAQAEELLARAVEANPRSSRARMAMGQVQELHLKKTQEALNTYRELKQLASERKLDESVQQLNLDEKIQSLEKSLSQVNKGSQVTIRKPTAERQVRK